MLHQKNKPSLWLPTRTAPTPETIYERVLTQYKCGALDANIIQWCLRRLDAIKLTFCPAYELYAFLLVYKKENVDIENAIVHMHHFIRDCQSRGETFDYQAHMMKLVPRGEVEVAQLSVRSRFHLALCCRDEKLLSELLVLNEFEQAFTADTQFESSLETKFRISNDYRWLQRTLEKWSVSDTKDDGSSSKFLSQVYWLRLSVMHYLTFFTHKTVRGMRDDGELPAYQQPEKFEKMREYCGKLTTLLNDAPKQQRKGADVMGTRIYIEQSLKILSDFFPGINKEKEPQPAPPGVAPLSGVRFFDPASPRLDGAQGNQESKPRPRKSNKRLSLPLKGRRREPMTPFL